MLKAIKKFYRLYMEGAKAHDFPISEYGLFGEKKRDNSKDGYIKDVGSVSKETEDYSKPTVIIHCVFNLDTNQLFSAHIAKENANERCNWLGKNQYTVVEMSHNYFIEAYPETPIVD